MLDRILAFKSGFIEAHSDDLTDFPSFIDALSRHFNDEYSIVLGDQDGYWKSYIHATCLSTLFEILGYKLSLWKQYFDNLERISGLIGPGSNTEWRILELLVLHSINHVFDFGSNPLHIKAFVANDDSRPTYLTDDTNEPSVLTSKENQRVLSNLKAVMKIRGIPKKEIWGDNDIIVTLKHDDQVQQYCIISCKTSLRERVYQSVFWSMHSRLQGIGKHVFITLDKGASGASEIGNRDSDPNHTARKTRDVLESTMDRVYVFRNQAEVNRSAVIKDFQYLQHDLNSWAKDVAGVY